MLLSPSEYEGSFLNLAPSGEEGGSEWQCQHGYGHIWERTGKARNHIILGTLAHLPSLTLTLSCAWFAALNGGTSAASSYSRQPSDQMSDLAL